jgi:hypothetical protein
MHERFQELLPWYVNGTLDEADRVWMDSYIETNSAARSEYAFFETMSKTMQTKTAAVPDTIGMARLFQRIDAERKPSSGKTNASEKRAPWYKLLLSDVSWLRPALAMSLAVVAFQSVMLLQRSDDAVKYRGSTATQGGSVSNASFYRVLFRPTATEGEVRVLLASLHAEIVAGPNAGGEYILRIQTGDSTSAASQLQASGLIVGMSQTVSP